MKNNRKNEKGLYMINEKAFMVGCAKTKPLLICTVYRKHKQRNVLDMLTNVF